MGDALCLMFTDPTILDAQDVTGGALFLRLRTSWVVLCASGSPAGPLGGGCCDDRSAPRGLLLGVGPALNDPGPDPRHPVPQV